MKTISLALILCLTLFTGSVSGSINLQPETWILSNVTGIDRCVDTYVTSTDSGFNLILNLDSSEIEDGRFGVDENLGKPDETPTLDDFNDYPVRFYRKSLTINESNRCQIIETLTLLDEYFIDLTPDRDVEFRLERYRDMDNMVMKIGEDSIWYNGASQRIIVERDPGFGDSWANSINFTAIWNADQAAGWNYVEMLGKECFFFKCGLQVGSPGRGVYFYDTNKRILFDKEKPMSVYEGYFKLGNLLNETYIITDNGCEFIFDFGIFRSISFYDTNYTIYDTVYRDGGSKKSLLRFESNNNTINRFWGCEVKGVYMIQTSGEFNDTQPIFQDVFLNNTHLGVQITNTPNTKGFIESIYIYESYYPLMFMHIDSMCRIYDARTLKIHYSSIYLYRCNAPIHITDSIIEEWKIYAPRYVGYNWTLYRDYTFNLLTTPEALITIKNRTGYIVTCNLSDLNGSLTEQFLTDKIWYKNDTTNYLYESNGITHNPYTILIEKDGYETYTQTINITNSFFCQINLIPIPLCDKWKCKPIAVILITLFLIFLSMYFKSPLLLIMTALYLIYIALTFTQSDKLVSLLLVGIAIVLLANSYICSVSEGDTEK